MILNFREIQQFCGLYWVSVHIYKYVWHLGKIYIWLSSPQNMCAQIMICQHRQERQLYLKLISHLLELEKRVLGVPGVQETEAFSTVPSR